MLESWLLYLVFRSERFSSWCFQIWEAFCLMLQANEAPPWTLSFWNFSPSKLSSIMFKTWEAFLVFQMWESLSQEFQTWAVSPWCLNLGSSLPDVSTWGVVSLMFQTWEYSSWCFKPGKFSSWCFCLSDFISDGVRSKTNISIYNIYIYKFYFCRNVPVRDS